MISENKSKYGLSGSLKAKTEKVAELVAILLQAADLVSTAKGCHLYLVSRDAQDNNRVWITEVWDTKEDHDNSLNIPGCRDLIAKAIPLLDGQPEKGTELEVIGGAGINLRN